MKKRFEEATKHLYEELKPYIECGLLEREWEEFAKTRFIGSAWMGSMEKITFSHEDTIDSTFFTDNKKDMEKLGILIVQEFGKPILNTHRINSSRDRIMCSLAIALSAHEAVMEISFVRGEIKVVDSKIRFGVMFKDDDEYVYGIGPKKTKYTEVSLSHNLIVDLQSFITDVIRANL